MRPDRKLALLLSPLAMLVILGAYANAGIDESLKGQWIGTAQLTSNAARTPIALVLGTPQQHDGILKLQDKTTCALTMGTYTANPNGTWRLSFDEVNGGGLCSRMADSTFTVKKGLLAEQLLVDATYSAENGTTTKRRIVLRHYP